MAGRIIRTFGSIFYKHSAVPEDIVGQGKFGKVKIALVTDSFTTECLSMECRIRSLTPQNYEKVIKNWKPDLVFVESVFHGQAGTWRYEVAKQPTLLRLTKPTSIFRLVEFAQARGIPTVFWNKDDGAFFDAFIDVAKVFDYIFTTDSRCLERYRQHVPTGVAVNTLPMPYQPAFHNFTGFHFVRNEACFAGSYYRRILSERKRFLDMVFDVCEDVKTQLNIFDRNHHRFSHHFEFRFPQNRQLRLHCGVAHRATARIYKEHAMSLNVNSVVGSETMYSRRLLEILACGGIAVTNPSRAVDKLFCDYCQVVSTREEAIELFSRLRFGPSREDMERAEAGARYVRNAHTWEQRLENIIEIVRV